MAAHARENGRWVVADLKSSMGGYPGPQDLAKINKLMTQVHEA